jgi:hypothetical protein
MRNIKQIFNKEFGFNENQLNSLARIFYYYEFDGETRDSAPKQSQLDEILEKEISEKDLNDLLQKNIFHKIRGGGERQQIKNSDFSDDAKFQLLQDFKNIGFIDKISLNTKKEYDFAIIYGATQNLMKSRIDNFLDDLLPTMKKKPEQIFILTGERDSWLDHENLAKEILLEKINKSLERKNADPISMENLDAEIATLQFESLTLQRNEQAKHFSQKYGIKFPTEYDIANQIFLDRTDKSENEKIKLVSVNKKSNGSRPTTEDTLQAFITYINTIFETPYRPIHILAVSNQPYVSSQDMSIRSLPKNFSKLKLIADTVGDDFKGTSLNVLVCELAGTINRCPLFRQATTSLSSTPILSDTRGDAKKLAEPEKEAGKAC